MLKFALSILKLRFLKDTISFSFKIILNCLKLLIFFSNYTTSLILINFKFSIFLNGFIKISKVVNTYI